MYNFLAQPHYENIASLVESPRTGRKQTLLSRQVIAAHITNS